MNTRQINSWRKMNNFSNPPYATWPHVVQKLFDKNCINIINCNLNITKCVSFFCLEKLERNCPKRKWWNQMKKKTCDVSTESNHGSGYMLLYFTALICQIWRKWSHYYGWYGKCSRMHISLASEIPLRMNLWINMLPLFF